MHYSTDFVFDGTATAPYTETDQPNPKSTYAASKLLGEWFAADAPRAYVLRVESLFGRAAGGGPSKGSVASIVKTLLAGGEARVFEDRTVSATYIIDAAAATLQLVEKKRAGWPLPLREHAGTARGSSSRGNWRRNSASNRGSCPCGWPA